MENTDTAPTQPLSKTEKVLYQKPNRVHILWLVFIGLFSMLAVFAGMKWQRGMLLREQFILEKTIDSLQDENSMLVKAVIELQAEIRELRPEDDSTSQE